MDRASLLVDPPFELTPADREVLQQTDENYGPHTWEELKRVCATKDTSSLRRRPTDAWNYMRWHRQTSSQYPSVVAYLLQERLHWADAGTGGAISTSPRSPLLFGHPADYRIIRNDWPYGFEPGVVHLLVWSKVVARVKGRGDDAELISEDEALIRDFIMTEFVKKVAERTGEDAAEVWGRKVLWFRNPTRYQSVRTLEHVHVLLRNIDEDLIEAWTGTKAADITALQWRKRKWD